MADNQYTSMIRKALDAVNVLSQPKTYEDQVADENQAMDEGAVKRMMMDMEEYAADHSKEEFIKKYGANNVDIYDKVQKEKEEMGVESAQPEGESTMSESNRLDKIAGLEQQLADLKTQEKEDAIMDADTFRSAFINDITEYVKEADPSALVNVYNSFSTNKVEMDENSNFIMTTPENAEIIADVNDVEPEGDEEVVADDAEEEVAESRKPITEGIQIKTDSLEDQIALMTILKNAGIDPAMMKAMAPQQAPMQTMPDMGAPEGPMPDMDQEPEAEAYANEPDEKFLDKDDYELKRNVVKNKDMGPSAASRGDNPLPEAKHAKPDYIDLDKDGDKEESMKKAAKDKKAKEKMKKEDTEQMIEELNKQYELMLIGGLQESLGLTASAKVIADEQLFDGSRFVIANVIEKGEDGLVAEDGAWEGTETGYTVAYHVQDGKITGQTGAGEVPYLSKDGNGTYPLKHKLNNLNLDARNFFEDQITAVDSLKAMYEELGAEMFGEVSTDFGGCEMVRSE